MGGQTTRPARAIPALPRHPDLLARPLARPLERHELEARRRVRGRPAARAAPRPRSRSRAAGDHLAVGEVELDRGAVGVVPLDPVEPELRAREAVGRDSPRRRAEQSTSSGELVRKTSRPPGRSSRAASAIQRSGRTRGSRRTPRARSRSSRRAAAPPRRRPRRAGTRGRARPACARAVASWLVDWSIADRPRAAAGEPGREVGGAAAELDRVEAVDVGQRADLRLGDLPDAPDGSALAQLRRAVLDPLGRELGPELAVDVLVAHAASALPWA